MLGAIVGDIVGSTFEFDRGPKSTEFELFAPGSNYTDDTVMTLAVGHAVMDSRGNIASVGPLVVRFLREYADEYPCPMGGYGGRFAAWLESKIPVPYDSFGNGSAMRVSSVGWLCGSLAETEAWAEETARVTHNHPEGIKGAQATAAAIYLARTLPESESKKREIRRHLETTYSYDLSRTVDDIRPNYRHVESCQETVPEAITAYLESEGFEHAIRLAVSLGGDCDTLTAITGSIAEAAYGVPAAMAERALNWLPHELRGVYDRFNDLRSSTHRLDFC